MQWQNLGQINVAVQAPMEGLKAFEHAAMLNDRDVVSLVGAGQIYVQSGRIPEARAAFDKALAVNAQDVQALCGAASVAQREGRAKDANEMRRQVASVAERCSDASGNATVRVGADELLRGKASP
jgi:cytochrome c-type biogenesis protein CcmH/NrfG